MSFDVSFVSALQEWVESRSSIIESNNFSIEFDSIQIPSPPMTKAVVRFAHENVIGQVDIWGTGELDVMFMSMISGKEVAYHRILSSSMELADIMDGCWSDLKRQL